MKYSKVYIGVLNDKNIDQIENIEIIPGTCVALLINTNLFELAPEKIEKIKNKNVIIISNKENIKRANKYKKLPTHALLVDWVLKQPLEMRFLLKNDSLLYVAYKDDNWHKSYDGEGGYAVTTATQKEHTVFHGLSVSVANNLNKLILKEFDGYCLKNL